MRHSGRVRTPLIDNPRSPRVRAVAKLTKRDARTETGLFLLEGPQAVSEALAFRPELVVEVRYDQVTDRRFRHGTQILRWRPDKAPAQCRMDQLARELKPAELEELLGV